MINTSKENVHTYPMGWNISLPAQLLTVLTAYHFFSDILTQDFLFWKRRRKKIGISPIFTEKVWKIFAFRDKIFSYYYKKYGQAQDSTRHFEKNFREDSNYAKKHPRHSCNRHRRRNFWGCVHYGQYASNSCILRKRSFRYRIDKRQCDTRDIAIDLSDFFGNAEYCGFRAV